MYCPLELIFQNLISHSHSHTEHSHEECSLHDVHTTSNNNFIRQELSLVPKIIFTDSQQTFNNPEVEVFLKYEIRSMITDNYLSVSLPMRNLNSLTIASRFNIMDRLIKVAFVIKQRNVLFYGEGIYKIARIKFVIDYYEPSKSGQGREFMHFSFNTRGKETTKKTRAQDETKPQSKIETTLLLPMHYRNLESTTAFFIGGYYNLPSGQKNDSKKKEKAKNEKEIGVFVKIINYPRANKKGLSVYKHGIKLQLAFPYDENDLQKCSLTYYLFSTESKDYLTLVMSGEINKLNLSLERYLLSFTLKVGFFKFYFEHMAENTTYNDEKTPGKNKFHLIIAKDDGWKKQL